MIGWRAIAVGAMLLCPAGAAAQDWTTSWATSSMAMVDENVLPPGEGPVTVEQTVRLSVGGERMRIRLTNRDGTQPLAIREVLLAPEGEGAGRPVTFGGEASVLIPAGAEFVSDAVSMKALELGRVRVRLRFDRPEQATGHPGARATTRVRFGDGASVEVTQWFHIAAIDVAGPAAGTVAILGDSITDGYGVVTDSDGRWSDYLARRLEALPGPMRIGVANLGIGGNRLLRDGLGPNLLARIDRELWSLENVDSLIVLIGVNDLGTLTREAPVPEAQHRALVADMLGGYRQLVARARGAGIRVLGATILPYAGSGYYHPDAINEADRQAINAFIRAPGNFDAVIDLDAAMRDPQRPTYLRADLDSGDGLHPSDAGYRAMADAVPLDLLVQD
ncbi:SGNH/GDSL hydrolase family protein [Sphingomonas japonica]|uniref:Lysophospholipase L1-like esterase n=1 Tax=Sphingomonas japonica TaxID=511662 RepID=A0ABX0TXL8_9SPHN|nr:SGNH/GDSL hydrolase family protein [Sphingomonas japonica]NIJ23045.1 lysophospholipase L1-like esterase [Sphingomonas japonica]